MAKQIVILEKLPGPVSFRFALWAVAPVARRSFYANPTATSAFKDASQVEIDAIRAGEVVERVETGSWPGLTLAQVQTALQARWTAFQAEINGTNEWQRYGTHWDGTTWTAGGA